MQQTFDMMERYNVVTGVVTGSMARLRQWKAAAPDRVIPAIGVAPADSIRKWASEGTIGVLGEFYFQYGGVSPTDPIVEPYFALAEELDLPIGFHVGFGPVATPYVRGPTYRMSLSNPLLLGRFANSLSECAHLSDGGRMAYARSGHWASLRSPPGLPRHRPPHLGNSEKGIPFVPQADRRSRPLGNVSCSAQTRSSGRPRFPLQSKLSKQPSSWTRPRSGTFSITMPLGSCV